VGSAHPSLRRPRPSDLEGRVTESSELGSSKSRGGPAAQRLPFNRCGRDAGAGRVPVDAHSSSNSQVSGPSSEEPETAPLVKEQQSRAAAPARRPQRAPDRRSPRCRGGAGVPPCPPFRAKRGCLSIAAPCLAETEAGLTSGRPWASRCRSLPQLGRRASRPGRTGRRPRAQARNRVDRADARCRSSSEQATPVGAGRRFVPYTTMTIFPGLLAVWG
jgi:hypothetical protein